MVEIRRAIDSLVKNQTWNNLLNAALAFVVFKRFSASLFLLYALGPTQYFTSLYKHVLQVKRLVNGLTFLLIFSSYFSLPIFSTSSRSPRSLSHPRQVVFRYLKMIPSANRLIQSKMQKSIDDLQDKIVPKNLPKIFAALPASGLSDAQVRTELMRFLKMNDMAWKEGKVSGAIYTGSEELQSIITEAYSTFIYTNPLHPG